MLRYDVINTLIASCFQSDCCYLEIGLKRAANCFDHVRATTKMSVDPECNGATYRLTSDDFFQQLREGRLSLFHQYRWDIVFIDGLHLAAQAWRDIQNALQNTTPTGFVVVHDCNPPGWENAHSDYRAYLAEKSKWCGTTWKAFYHFRTIGDRRSFVVDTDYGVGVIDKAQRVSPISHANQFLDFGEMSQHRREHLGLVSVADFKLHYPAMN